jgi:prepilin-type N-terminal cleavage/methylation domain-containing protein
MTNTQPRRPAFTLVELLIAIAIMLVLVALVAAGVFKAFGTAKQVTATNDIQQLAVGLENFKTKYGFYPPSRLKLCGNKNEYSTTTQLDVDSVAYLQRMFPQIGTINYLPSPPNPPLTVDHAHTAPWADPTPGTSALFQYWIQWDGKYSTTSPPYTATYPTACILEGDQCLTFFLGGIPATGATPLTLTGFSQAPFDPSTPQTQGEVRQSCFDFSGYLSRLIVQAPNGNSFSASGPAGFPRSTVQPSLMDVWGQQPYLYFSSYKTADGYFRYQANGSLADTAYTGTAWNTVSSDCPTFGSPPGGPIVGVWPYAATINQASGYVTFENSQTFQILCAGKNGQWGLGTYDLNHFWPPTQQQFMAPDTSLLNMRDDLSNFATTPLGVSSN